MPPPTRRQFIQSSAAALAGVAAFPHFCPAQTSAPSSAPAATRPTWPGPIIDVHQHTTYRGRSDAALLYHQRKMGVTQTILLPAGSPTNSASTLKGRANGLEAQAGVTTTVLPIVRDNPGQYYFMANEVPDLDGATKTIEQSLKNGAIGIGEQKFNLPCDSKEMLAIYDLARAYRVPVLMHFQHETYNTGYERFGQILAKYHDVNFIGHAPLFWAHIDAKANPNTHYPTGKVTPGGLTDHYLSDHPNLYADLSAYSGLNAFTRDEDHARAFIARHAGKLLFGSDCADPAGAGPQCTGASMIAAIQRLAPTPQIASQLLHDNARALFNL